MAGPKGHPVSLPFYIDGVLICTMDRASQHDRRVFRHHNACSKNHRLGYRSRCTHCDSILEAKQVPDVDALVGVKDPADTDEGKAQREAASSIPHQVREAVAIRAASAIQRAKEAAEEVPTKLVCSSCSQDYASTEKPFCEACDSFIESPLLTYEREGQSDFLLSDVNRRRVEERRMQRGLNFIGVLPVGFTFNEWETGETFSLVPRDNNERVHEFRAALHHLQTGALVYYCSANENKTLTLKNEWVAVIRTAKGGRSLLLTQLRAEEDTTHREHNLGGYTPGVHAFMGLFMARKIDSDHLKVFRRQSKARSLMARLLGSAATTTPLAGPVGQPGDISRFLEELKTPSE